MLDKIIVVKNSEIYEIDYYNLLIFNYTVSKDIENCENIF